jgi:GTP pyrophosphokinase
VDNFRQLLESMQYDVRAVLIKLADRLHNMRTLESMRPDKQMKIAGETDYFYAPLANRLGLYHVKSELETLSFRFRCPREFSEINDLLSAEKEKDLEYLEQFTCQINAVLAEAGIPVRTQVRYRMPYSIWRKMRTKGCDFDHVSDKHYIRIIFPDNTGMSEKIMSLRIYAVLTDHFKERPGSFSNYIDAPKENGYESLHIKLLNSKGTWEEIHIASERMVRKSRLGCAADQTSENLLMWLENFKNVLKKVAEDSASSNFIDEVRLLFEYNDDIMVFTPKGENIVLPKGATALDYAFQIHGEIGEHAMYARINGKLTSVKTVLHRGDCVEIGLGKEVQIKADWIGHMVTYKAKKAVKSYLAKQPKPDFTRCACCNPLPGDEVIGYGEDPKRLTLHKRDCHELIRLASQHGNHIHEADLHEDPDTLYPVRLIVRAVDRYHLLSDLIDCITEKLKLSMTSLGTETADNIGTCTIDFCIHSAAELRFAINSIKEIEGVDEVSRASI